jgi:hypothetical protein
MPVTLPGVERPCHRPQVADTLRVRMARLGGVLGEGLVRTGEHRKLHIHAPVVRELMVERERKAVVVGVSFDLAVGRQLDRASIDCMGARTKRSLRNEVVTQ